MPPVPRYAGPAEASPTGASAKRPPHPAIPVPLVEPEPTRETLESSAYRWLPGHWIWTGNHYEWQSGLWIYEVPGYALVPPQWSWDGYEWLFVDAGWAVPGTRRVVYRPTAVRTDALDEQLAFDGSAPAEPRSANAVTPDVYVEARSYAAYSWPGYWIAPPILYPIWHPYYHYHWHHHHQPHARPPLYHDGRYEYARKRTVARAHPAGQQQQTWERVDPRSAPRPAVRPVIPNTVRTRALSSGDLDLGALRNPGDLDPSALQATSEQRAIRAQADGRRTVYGVPAPVPVKRDGPDPSALARPRLPSARPGSSGALRAARPPPPQAPSPVLPSPRVAERGVTRQAAPSANVPVVTPAPRSSLPQPAQRSVPRLSSPKATPTSRAAPSTGRPRPTSKGPFGPNPALRRVSPAMPR